MTEASNEKKSFSDLREAIGVVVGDIMSPSYLMYLRKFASQFSSVYQPDPAKALDRIELELNKYGYSLLLDSDHGIEEGEGGDDYMIYVASTGDPIKNVYLQFDYEEVSGQQVSLRDDGGKLRYDVHITFEEIDIGEMDHILAGAIASSDNPDFHTEEE